MHRFSAFLIFAVLVACTNAATVATTGRFDADLNQLRSDSSLQPVGTQSQLQRAAQAHADDMARRGYFSHQTQGGGNAGTRIAAAGYQACGYAENIAQGQQSHAEVFAAWQSSRGHLSNMLGQSYTDYGLGRAGDTWVLVLGRRC